MHPERARDPTSKPRRLLITAGPTHEPLDAVRFLGNRSSGRLGVALADAAAGAWRVELLLGPVAATPADSRVTVHRFRTCADLGRLLDTHAPDADVIVMAAAVADFRPVPDPSMWNGKFRRTDAPVTLTLEPTPDLIAGLARTRRPGQFIVGFALEPRAEMLASARRKLDRKGIDLVIANPLETMDSPTIEAVALDRSGGSRRTDGPIPKSAFAPWLLALIEEHLALRASRP